MRILSFIIILFLFQQGIFCQSPHGSGLKYDCSLCHQPSEWKVISSETEFNHSTTNFILTGQHASVKCRSCHTELKFNGTPQNCISCHKDIHMNTVGLDCSGCHSPNSWTIKDLTGLHQRTRFPLAGAHIRTDCVSCHKLYSSLIFNVQGVKCYDCHASDYSNTRSPGHVEAGFSKECEQCHTINSDGWSGGKFLHDFFPLTGGHHVANCFTCHTSGSLGRISSECYSCHKKDYEGAADPDHVSAQFSTDCSGCHTITKWGDGIFDHSQGNFPLTGAHININCRSCHITTYSGTPNQCVSCHQNNYNSAQNHLAQGYPQDCKMCHNTTIWNQTTFDHNTTSFPLTGAHLTTQCGSCHIATYSGTPNQCVSCHQNDYNSAQNHLAQGYPQDCKMCHNTTIWNQTIFDHNATQFPLTGVHLTTQCGSCHTSVFQGTPKECFSCHQKNYNESVNPNHTALAIPVTCQDCHSVNPNWEPATFSIHNNFYVIAGAHLQITSCTPCHNGNYISTPNTCYGCHQKDYNATANPAHSIAGFSHECLSCHTQNAWKPSTFNHDGQYFPIYSGHHAGAWTLCSTCHTNPADFKIFSCITCHEHNQTEMNSKHNGVPNYSYNSIACYGCHPTGSSGRVFIKGREIENK